MRTRKALISVTPLLVAVGCGEPDTLEQSPPLNVANQLGTFEPRASTESPPAWVVELRQEMQKLAAEGIAMAVPERPPKDRAGWLIYDPALSPPNWIVSDGANLPGPEGALQTEIAYLRSRQEGAFALGFTRDGRLVNELSAETVSRPLSITRAGPGVPVAFDIVRSDSWEAATLPIVGRVRYHVITVAADDADWSGE